VQAVGRNQAVIIHTATGRHFQELQAQFADIGCFNSERELNPPAEDLAQQIDVEQ